MVDGLGMLHGINGFHGCIPLYISVEVTSEQR